MHKWIGGIIDRLCVVCGALLFSQIPSFIQQYSQRLAGHVAELKIQTTALAQAAHLSGKTIDQLIAKFLASGDPDFIRQGELMQHTFVRFHHLSTALAHLQESNAFSRPFIFFSQLDPAIAEGTFKDFAFGVSLTIEGGIYALGGMIIGALSYRLLSFCGRFLKNLGLFVWQAISPTKNS
ncbi:DUF2937 family protein [Parachlamydia sp. AcF125]|uniref:DUF2937 family protein n=1 Tax=Parachlamydia sp. AcF125 TaxID=2795736 RepID=UPI001BCA029B|nr:DUF2937 family protein [Parachlamydia sp. AcF125]MBS4168396.1 hypothetical protein [Parachlamydia sp. AcF125]